MYIQMVTALVLQLIQCVVHLPSSEKDPNSEEDSNKKVRKYLFYNFVCTLRIGNTYTFCNSSETKILI